MKNSFIICLLIIAACQHKEVANNKNNRIDSLKKTLIGNWGGFDEDDPIWKITYDSIYAYSENKSYPYSIIETDLVINMNKSYPKLKHISVNKDTLFFYLPANIQETTYILTKAFRHK